MDQNYTFPVSFNIWSKSRKCERANAIQIATQLPATNTKTAPWNYNKVVTHKRKEIIKETNETRGLTRSEVLRPKELRDKQAKENQLPLKPPTGERSRVSKK
ncbi:hypothetical protein H5410_063303 [Solanum commersonii]|uniref:Uncharacterized protein n=1 Tax=Solanum commersonii TaxID=4109 RepID=A0A9J5WCW5_SOLCO|nr:hypothetical protein H5410_063303 [Solanum commersonii]